MAKVRVSVACRFHLMCFGFCLAEQFSMERAAFKFTPEYVEVLGGKGSNLYEEFVEMFTKGIMAARKYAAVTITMIEIMMFQVPTAT